MVSFGAASLSPLARLLCYVVRKVALERSLIRCQVTLRARLQPDVQSGRENFNLHDSTKGETHGCIETCEELFREFLRYSRSADFIRVHVDYTGTRSTLGPTKR